MRRGCAAQLNDLIGAVLRQVLGQLNPHGAEAVEVNAELGLALFV